jgi:hypothetical protein
MAGPFYNLVKGTAGSAPGTGAFTPSTAPTGYQAWSNVPTGWFGLVRFDDGTAWELAYAYWNGTTLSRSSTQIVKTSTGSLLTLSASSTAALIADGSRVSPNLIVPIRGLFPIPGAATTPTAVGLPAATVTGTAAAGALAATNFLTMQPRVHVASATTANAQAGYAHTTLCGLTSTTAGNGGWDFNCRFGHSGALPTGPRAFIGMTGTTFVANTAEPSALVANYAVFGFDSTDTNIQLITNSNAGAGTKVNTGIAFVANGWYEADIWCDPGSSVIKALLVRLDTGAIFYTETNTDVPATGSLMMPQCMTGLSATTGTAFTLAFGGYTIQTGGW